MPLRIPRHVYADLYGPTTGDRVDSVFGRKVFLPRVRLLLLPSLAPQEGRHGARADAGRILRGQARAFPAQAQCVSGGGEFRETSPFGSAQRRGLTRLRGRLSLIGWRLTPEGETGCALSSWPWLRRH